MLEKKDRAKSLACAVSGEARAFEELVNFQPEKGAILANATPLGMHPNTDQRIPVVEVSTFITTAIKFPFLFITEIICFHFPGNLERL